MDCLAGDWTAWYRALRVARRTETPCACGQHALHSFLVHDRWAFLVAAPRPLMLGGEAVMTQAARTLATLLPAARGSGPPGGGGGGGGGGPEPARLGIPLWWARQ